MRRNNKTKTIRLEVLSKFLIDVAKGLVVGAMISPSQNTTGLMTQTFWLVAKITIACALLSLGLYFKIKGGSYAS